LLSDVWGEVPQKETTAIMGPSGAGKTSLLNILAGRATTGGRIKITSDVRLNNFTVDPTNIAVRKLIAFVAQDDSLQVTSTPREAIMFSAKLRLPRSTTDSQLEKLTNRMIEELGLTTCCDTIVGGELIKGISGGERKRTSVGVELVTKPALVFLDEPTSGLDSYSAVQLCQVLKKVANAGSSVLFTIHQPSSEIFNSFDRLILMNKGRVMFQGPVGEVPDYFSDHGFPSPPNYNPADWVMVSMMLCGILWCVDTLHGYKLSFLELSSNLVPSFPCYRMWRKSTLWKTWMLLDSFPKVRLFVGKLK
jgi:ABC-type multidrug transport system ATPase subunit